MWAPRRARDEPHYCCDGGGSVVRVAGDESAPLPLSWRHNPHPSMDPSLSSTHPHTPPYWTFSITFVWVSSWCTRLNFVKVLINLSFYVTLMTSNMWNGYVFLDSMKVTFKFSEIYWWVLWLNRSGLCVNVLVVLYLQAECKAPPLNLLPHDSIPRFLSLPLPVADVRRRRVVYKTGNTVYPSVKY